MVDCDTIAETDMTGSLHDVHDTLARANTRLIRDRVNHGVLEHLKRDGVPKDLGDDAVCPTVSRSLRRRPGRALSADHGSA